MAPGSSGGCVSAVGLAAGISRVVIACAVSADLLLFDKAFDGGQGVGVEAGRGQLGVQLPGLGGPVVAGAFGFVEGGVGGQGVEFVPGQVVADRQPPRGVSVVAALRQRVEAAGGGGLSGAQPGPGRQRGGVGGDQVAGRGNGDRFGQVAFRGLQITGGLGAGSQRWEGRRRVPVR